MKKTLVALAALATVGAAFAQSSVTLYGRIDVSIGSQKNTTGGVTTAAVSAAGPATYAADGTLAPAVPKAVPYGDKGTRIMSGGHTGSRWGLKGSEDLGGGLKANFQLEQGFAVDTGAAIDGTKQFSRVALVGLSGNFGSVTLGRQYDIVDSMYANYDAMGYSSYAAMGYAFNVGCGAAGGGGDCIARQDNSVLYTTPAMGGFSGSIMWAPGENATPGISAGNMYGLMASYGNGPFSFGAGWQSNKGAGAPATTNWVLGGSYDFTAAKLYAQFEGTNNKATTGKDDGYQLGVLVPVGAANLVASYAHENQKIGGAKVSTSKAWSLKGEYPLSKRTYLYAAYLRGTTSPTGPAPKVEQTNYGLGLVHNF